MMNRGNPTYKPESGFYYEKVKISEKFVEHERKQGEKLVMCFNGTKAPTLPPERFWVSVKRTNNDETAAKQGTCFVTLKSGWAPMNMTIDGYYYRWM